MKLDLTKIVKPKGSTCWDYDQNPAEHPEIFGLTVVAAIDWSEEAYQFDCTVVWQDSEGRLWYGEDSGCSCPTPFEHHLTLDRLFNMEPLDARYEKERPKQASWEKLKLAIRQATS